MTPFLCTAPLIFLTDTVMDKMGLQPIPPVKVPITIGKMLNFNVIVTLTDMVINGDVKQTLRKETLTSIASKTPQFHFKRQIYINFSGFLCFITPDSSWNYLIDNIKLLSLLIQFITCDNLVRRNKAMISFDGNSSLSWIHLLRLLLLLIHACILWFLYLDKNNDRGPGLYGWFICFPHAGSQSSRILFNRQMIMRFTDILINKYSTKYYSYTHLVKLKVDNKNTFQWDAYRPLVDRIPACTTKVGFCLWFGGVCPEGVSTFGPGGAVYPSMQWDRHPPVDRKTPVKT